jgi:Domain of unknown function (DUF4169)
MAEIVNLKRARKGRAQAERENQAAANRRLFGRTKAEKTADVQTTARDDKSFQGKKLEPEKS